MQEKDEKLLKELKDSGRVYTIDDLWKAFSLGAQMAKVKTTKELDALINEGTKTHADIDEVRIEARNAYNSKSISFSSEKFSSYLKERYYIIPI